MNKEEWSPQGWLNIREIIRCSKYEYSDDFLHWLKSNLPVWKAFVDKAKTAKKFESRHRFSARAIIQSIRWDTVTSEKDPVFKIGNNHTPDLARLLMDCSPEFDGFFSLRQRTTNDRH